MKKRSSPKFSARIFSNLPEFISTGRQVLPVSYAYDNIHEHNCSKITVSG